MVKTLLLITILAFLAAISLLVVIALYWHKRAGASDLTLVGELARVENPLAPEGTILVSGELWNAKSIDGSEISSDCRVRVIALEGHLLLVKLSNEETTTRRTGRSD